MISIATRGKFGGGTISLATRGYGAAVITRLRTEVIRLVSGLTRTLSLRSKI